jgi:multiple sugar transport system permease protein
MRGRTFALSVGKAIVIVLIALWSLVPIAFIFVSSLKPDRDIFAVPPSLSFTPTIQHYISLWTRWSTFFDGLLNSLIITVFATGLAVTASAMAGFAYSRRRTPGMQRSALLLILVRLVPPIVLTLPLFPMINGLRLNDTHFALIVLYATFFVSLGTILMRTFIDQIPRELDDAVLVDGGSQWTVFVRIILPLALQGMLAVAVFVIVFAWNEFLFAFIFTSSRAKTAPLVMSEIIGSFDGVDWGVLFAASTTQLVPILLFVLFTQKHLVSGLTAGALKG